MYDLMILMDDRWLNVPPFYGIIKLVQNIFTLRISDLFIGILGKAYGYSLQQ